MSDVQHDPRLDLEAALRRCFPHRDVKIYAGIHGSTALVFNQGYARHTIEIPTPETSRPAELRDLVLHAGQLILETCFPGAR